MSASKVRPSAAKKHEPKASTRRGKKSAVGKEKNTAKPDTKISKPRNWVPYVFIPVGLLGVAWLVVYYIAGTLIPIMSALGDWNILAGMGLMAAAFVIATLWK